jgi:thiaminase
LIAQHPTGWEQAVNHPFLEGIRNGSLPVAAFNLWLEQDYLFVADLLGFQARLLALAPRRAQKPLAAGLVALENELGWFETQAHARNVHLGGEPKPVTEAYRLALEGLLAAGFEPAITALWALERIYLEAWRRAAPGADKYRVFVKHWTPVEFAGYVEALELLADGGEAVEAAFLQVCGLERDFWEIAWSAQ